MEPEEKGGAQLLNCDALFPMQPFDIFKPLTYLFPVECPKDPIDLFWKAAQNEESIT